MELANRKAIRVSTFVPSIQCARDSSDVLMSVGEVMNDRALELPKEINQS